MSASLKFVISVLGTQLAGLVGAVFTSSSIPTWYALLEKPLLSPPNWVFGPVWTLLYFLMGVAAFLVWQTGGGRNEVRRALMAYGVQLVLNTLWSILFFGLQNPALAFLEILILWCAIAWTGFLFWRIRSTAGYLLLPYLAWVTFAAYLNASIALLN